MRRMLELGCGDNPRYQSGYDEYYAIELSEKAAGDAREKLRRNGFQVGTGPQDWIPHLNSFNATHFIVQGKAGYHDFPFDDNHFDFILGDQFLEHIPRQGFIQHVGGAVVEINPVINCLNECWRVAKPGAKVQFNVPKWNSKEMWQDPTHLNPVPPEFWVYFDEVDAWKLKESYGIKASLNLDETIDAGWYHVFKLTVTGK